jgi:predicted nuclease of predicted toxin-antitoxin system
VNFKLDENIGTRGLALLIAAGHDVMTVRDQNLGGCTDETLFDICAKEGRALLTLDHDFGQVLRFPPAKSAGVVILEPGRRATPASISDRLREFLTALATQPLTGMLWIVEPGRVRIHLQED